MAKSFYDLMVEAHVDDPDYTPHPDTVTSLIKYTWGRPGASDVEEAITGDLQEWLRTHSDLPEDVDEVFAENDDCSVGVTDLWTEVEEEEDEDLA